MTKFYLSGSRYLSVLIFFLLVATTAWSQSRTVTGRVTSEDDGSGIPGVNVVEKGTTNGTVTDVDGNYSINVSDNATLVFSFVGYAGQEIEVGNQSTINVVMAPDVTALEEVVVVGYGTQEKKEITSAVTSVKSEDFNRGTVNDPIQLLQGKVAGLTIARPGGDPNAGYTIRLRGVSTVGANAEPLIVIDGVIGGSLSTVDPNDIESIDVLKDGSAAAIYGTRGSSGVILITTKRGKPGQVSIDYNGSIATEHVARTMPFMTPEEYLEVPGSVDLGAETDWLDVVTRTGVSHVHNLSFGGGTTSTTYRASVNYRDVTGVGLNSGFDQLNGRLNLTQRAFNDKALFNLNLSHTSREAKYGDAAGFRYAVIANPTMPIYDETLPGDENASATPGGHLGGYAEFDAFDVFNPLSIVEQNIHDGRDTRLLASIRGEYAIVPSLRAAVFYARQWEADERGDYSPKTAKFGGGFGANGLATVQSHNRYNDLFETTLNYDHAFGSLNMALLAGYSYQNFFNEGFSIRVRNFLTDAFTYHSIGSALSLSEGQDPADLNQTYSYANRNELQAYFGRANFNYDGTYFLSLSARYEGSSRFGENNKYGLFPAASAGVTITNLVDLPTIDNLKARISWGVTGNQPNESYASLQRFGRQGNFYYQGNYVPSYGPISNANPDLAWETKDEINFGLDFTMLNTRLSGSLDYYMRNTRDLILRVTVPVPPNLFPTTLVNIGELSNRGFEAALNYSAVNTSNFRWNTGLNIATTKTIVESLTSGELSYGSGGVLYLAGVGSPGQNDYRISRVKEGEELGQFWSWKQIGISETGQPIFEDLDGDPTDDTEEDKQLIGQALPNLTVGFNNSFAWRNFDLNFFLRGVFGHDIMNSYRTFYENTGAASSYNVVKTKYYDERLRVAKYNSSHIEDGDFVKLDNITLGYTMPLDASAAVSRFRVYVSAQNPFVITGYTGIDPEVRYGDTEDNNNPLAPGIERRSTYFTTRIFTLGVNVGF